MCIQNTQGGRCEWYSVRLLDYSFVCHSWQTLGDRGVGWLTSHVPHSKFSYIMSTYPTVIIMNKCYCTLNIFFLNDFYTISFTAHHTVTAHATIFLTPKNMKMLQKTVKIMKRRILKCNILFIIKSFIFISCHHLQNQKIHRRLITKSLSATKSSSSVPSKALLMPHFLSAFTTVSVFTVYHSLNPVTHLSGLLKWPLGVKSWCAFFIHRVIVANRGVLVLITSTHRATPTKTFVVYYTKWFFKLNFWKNPCIVWWEIW